MECKKKLNIVERPVLFDDKILDRTSLIFFLPTTYIF